MSDIHPIFQACCSDEPAVYNIQKPWVKAGWLCATNGAIVVRRPTNEPDTEGKHPDVPKVLVGEFDEEPTPIPHTAYPTSKVPCENCDWEHWPREEAVVVVPDYRISNRWLAVLLVHDAVLYLPKNRTGDIKCAAKFIIAPEIEGRVMPMTLRMPRDLPKGDS